MPAADTLRWVHEDDPRWDADRERVFATVPEGVFRTEARQSGERLSSDWWRVERGGTVVGYGWLDDVWGDAEVLLAVEAAARGSGVGVFALHRLEEEAAARGLNYVLNVVRDTHPERAEVTAWFEHHGFVAGEDGRLRKRVGDRARDIGQHQDGRPGTGEATPPSDGRQARYLAERERAAGRPRRDDEPATVGADRGPGEEEMGGYVDPEQHRY
ncbi:N-acetylglutamate synthase, GNAT family [Geodermatophilus dictyosporus]|uniref:N-acetylglutamate synthase, GNAT family n=1 Tax=Geodermatophilus dictyosporus TaxID=1523247 RepID=A0A1I5JKY3_9ACTN|nr:GNAT family N-acetyltransferase [Geodermatophilus dictyosporus]SFO73395.1 N-acetylglutamate synthase, GNAT family [Geodermatophilus dictyosporus]